MTAKPAPLAVPVRAAVAFASGAAAHRLCPGDGPLSVLKRVVLRWAFRQYFAAELKPHLYAVPEEPKEPEAEAARRILQALSDGRETTRSELAASLDLGGSQTNRLLADLVRRGLIVSAGPNKVRLSQGASNG